MFRSLVGEISPMKLIDSDSREAVEFMECPSCAGLGFNEIYYNEYDIIDAPCYECNGDGVVEAL